MLEHFLLIFLRLIQSEQDPRHLSFSTYRLEQSRSLYLTKSTFYPTCLLTLATFFTNSARSLKLLSLIFVSSSTSSTLCLRSMMGDQKTRILLSKPKDWDTWIFFVRIKAETYEVWNLIDPDLPSKPNALTKPTQPTLRLGDTSTFNSKAFNPENWVTPLWSTCRLEAETGPNRSSSIFALRNNTRNSRRDQEIRILKYGWTNGSRCTLTLLFENWQRLAVITLSEISYLQYNPKILPTPHHSKTFKRSVHATKSSRIIEL